MSLKYVDHHGGYFVKIGSYYSSSSYSGNDAHFYTLDPVKTVLNGLSVDWGWFHVEDSIDVFRDRGSSTVLEVGRTKPVFREYSGSDDFAAYGSFLSSLAAGGRLLRGENLLSFLPGNEHQTRHPSYQGYVGPSLADDLYTYSPTVGNRIISSSFFGNILSLGTYVPNNLNGLYCTKVSASPDLMGSNFSTYIERPYDWAPRADFLTTCLFIRDTLVNGSEWIVTRAAQPGVGGPWHSRIYDFTVAPSLYGYTVQYKWIWEDLYPGNTYVLEHDVVIRCTLQPYSPSPSGYVVGGVWYGIQPIGDFKFSYDVTHTGSTPRALSWWPLPIGGSHHFENTTPGWIYLSRCVQGIGGSVSPDWDRFFSRRRLHSFEDAVSLRIGDIRLSSMQSANDALDDLSGSIDSNLVEALSELRDISELMPELSQALLSIVSLARGDKLMSAFQLLNFLTALRLTSTFGWDPTLDLALNVLPRMQKRLAQILGDTSNGVIAEGRGSFSYDFPPGEFGREHSRLLTRTKVVSRRGSNPLLEKILDVKSLGLLPSPSNLWDLVPFSFVADWFTGIGSRLSDAEGVGVLTLMNIQCFVHSYSVTSLLNSDELAADGLSIAHTNVSDPPMLKYYLRDVSQHPPRFGRGRYDFRLPGRLPNWMTAGSLSWQLLVAR